jgi:hypothetical protein
MAVTTRQVIEIDCPIDSIETTDILPYLEDGGACNSIDGFDAKVEDILGYCKSAFHPRGSYKIFNPAICTLPPEYREPAIKLVGTMMMFKGEEVYNRMRKATHTALLTVTLGNAAEPSFQPSKANARCDKAIYRACCKACLELAADEVNADIVREAMAEELYTDDRLSPGMVDFPSEAQSQILFYTQAQDRLGVTASEDGGLDPANSLTAVVGMYDRTQKNRRRACGRCKFRDFCSIRAIGMTCHGRKGTFDTPNES